jgi:hypothetical protein
MVLYNYHFDSFSLLNRQRREIGLPDVVQKKTNCLKCRKEFLSLDYPKNRICLQCKKVNSNEYEPEDMYGKVSISITFDS